MKTKFSHLEAISSVKTLQYVTKNVNEHICYYHYDRNLYITVSIQDY
jgi:hypothetical protein